MSKVMKSYRIGKMVQYGGEESPRFVRAEETSYMTWFEQFRDRYWTSKSEAEAALKELKAKWRAEAEEAQRYVSATDKPLFDRMANCACTQEDRHLPYYEQMSKARNAIDAWTWGQQFIIGESTEPSTIYRLNTLLKDSPTKVAELEEKMRYFGRCQIGWSCTGRTRARWQTEEDADWIRKHHPEYLLQYGYDGEDLYISRLP